MLCLAACQAISAITGKEGEMEGGLKKEEEKEETELGEGGIIFNSSGTS